MQESGPETRQVPVYASDGTTVVDTFTRQPVSLEIGALADCVQLT